MIALSKSIFNSCDCLKGVGPKTKQSLEKLAIQTIQDLLFHLPIRYEDRTALTPIHRLPFGKQALVQGTIEKTEIVYRGRRQLVCRVKDDTGWLVLRFFHFTLAQQQGLDRGTLIRCFGEVRYGQHGYEMIHPEYRRINPELPLPLETALTPVYPTTQGLSQVKWRQLITEAIQISEQSKEWVDLLPKDIIPSFHFPSIMASIRYLHRPPAHADRELLLSRKHPCQQRFIVEELLAHHLSLRHLREQTTFYQAPKLINSGKFTEIFLSQLPFQLTRAQRRVIKEIEQDLKKNSPMARLVQGDVGSGKTVVAAYSALLAIANQTQAVLMAPTELLAEQHLANFKRWLNPLGIEVVNLTSQLTARSRKEMLQKIKSGEAKMIIGTHALFQEEVAFHALSLVIIDEQHRFGVHQRLLLREKGRQKNQLPHQLIMTATPIPRTLAMMSYADLDYSAIDEMPSNRQSIQTVLIPHRRRSDVIQRVHQFCSSGNQAYWVCPLIEESETLNCQAAEGTLLELQQSWPDLSIALVHGRMKGDQRDAIMKDFKANRYAILVATTVVEVGIDVPNASLMVIDNAERLGLAQLHQLRGRVGRGSQKSHCLLIYQTPLSSKAKERLAVLRETQDGFKIAQKDLELRGPGEILGVRQSGLMQLKIADLIEDRALIPSVMAISEKMIREYPKNIEPLIHRWVPAFEQYGRV